ncbi:hypothetical protein ASU33_03225 [Solirubrum puertoriconensis]|uniref:TonB C-terminal domain-containing protein n=1 Tax=Solirubrum puertoriconensis TaxID=1751427 RepID=A0A9X0L3D6_SOLP1|nr:hypothetical protein ASU33_03225 [Solirubrum puertoriconensis]
MYTFAEQMPKFRGSGSDSIYAFINKNRQYPAEAAAQRLDGKVFVNFVVNPTGAVEHAKIVKSSNPVFEAEALRLVQMMPAWEPGKQNGRAVHVAQTLQINFPLPPVQPLLPGPRPVTEAYPPKPVGGQEALAAHLKNTLPYPEAARQAKTSALVFVKVLIDSTGQVLDATPFSTKGRQRNASKALQAPDKELIAAATSALHTGLTWQAAKRNGKAVKGSAVVPVLFDGLSGTVTLLNQIRLFPTEPPAIPGGPDAVLRFLSQNVKYPPSALRAGSQGQVIVFLEVSEEGRVENPIVVNSADPELDSEAVRAISQMPPVYPALENGKPVRSFFLVPVTFTIKGPITRPAPGARAYTR